MFFPPPPPPPPKWAPLPLSFLFTPYPAAPRLRSRHPSFDAAAPGSSSPATAPRRPGRPPSPSPTLRRVRVRPPSPTAPSRPSAQPDSAEGSASPSGPLYGATSCSASSPDQTRPSTSFPGSRTCGLFRTSITASGSLDHAVGQRHSIAPVVSYMEEVPRLPRVRPSSPRATCGTADSGLNSVGPSKQRGDRTASAERAGPRPTKRRSQIQTYLDHHGGPGVQHLALRSDDVIATVRKMKGVSGFGGFEFMEGPPPNYYEGVKRRAGDVLSEEQIRECQELGLLVDRDDQGVLVQIFTKPIGDRPTIFLEIIQRIGCMRKDDQGKEYQKGGCGGFGKGNFSELFKCIEEYEKTLEAKQQPTTVSA
ncbi:uncharacterized protein A4U43_C08F23880 [Asparagus officinalis]|nr:uncharacterized protein A4U43_C08F23880 [Asparagus officinalis]